jgi:hypothetical protein
VKRNEFQTVKYNTLQGTHIIHIMDWSIKHVFGSKYSTVHTSPLCEFEHHEEILFCMTLLPSASLKLPL